MPPGSSETTLNFTNRLIQLVQKYHSIIKNQFYGHTHSDQFIFYWNDKLSQALGHAYISSSIVPINRNPTFRIYEYNTESFEIVNYYHYLLNLTDVNLTNVFNYTLLYDALSAYKLDDLSTSSWLNLTQQFKSNTKLFNDYVFRYNSAYYNNSCTGQCQKNYLCEILFIDKDIHDQCTH